ncbi:uncharacterized protein K489DRAFT_212565 [Dissoconium aciculare CBS 342.82]|uniref:DUF2423 domain-containing protein n=1 Tax=Dissoconium aciculare CBS 342.82 TaxID=1314786 RepID=A0A6J3M3Q0_9PEZI|nr:uncharacterized protein K489DRAFT_212565 [Dissoconium aciculare CBS 342.82]KAF1822635.1 hypothetical protein K489DRAFT_212565 [Dissoconium aciculare CBS 342.82]
MAKSARASGIKKNKQALKKRVFGPVEIARNERLSAKLLALAKQPKPEREEMDVQLESEKKSSKKSKSDIDPASNAEGGMPSLSANSPLSSMLLRSLSPHTAIAGQQLQTPPPTPPDSPRLEDIAHEHFYLALGLSTDIDGFTNTGELDIGELDLASDYDSID